MNQEMKEETNIPEKKKGNIYFILTIVLLLLVGAFAGGYYLKGNMKDKCEDTLVTTKQEEKEPAPIEKVEKEDEKKVEAPASTTKDDVKTLTATIQKVYENAYNEMYAQFESNESSSVKIDFYGKKYEMKPIDTTKLKQYFTASELEKVLMKYSNYEKNGTYYFGYADEDWPSDLQTYEYFDPGTIFSVTDSGERTLEIKSYSENYILAQGEEVTGEYTNFGGEFIVFKKENGSWKIAMFE